MRSWRTFDCTFTTTTQCVLCGSSSSHHPIGAVPIGGCRQAFCSATKLNGLVCSCSSRTPCCFFHSHHLFRPRRYSYWEQQPTIQSSVAAQIWWDYEGITPTTRWLVGMPSQCRSIPTSFKTWYMLSLYSRLRLQNATASQAWLSMATTWWKEFTKNPFLTRKIQT